MRISDDRHPDHRTVSRRQLLRLAAYSASGFLLLTACATSTRSAPAPTTAAKVPTTAPAATTAPQTTKPAGQSAGQPAQQTPGVTASGTIRIATPRQLAAIEARRHQTTEEQQVFFHLYDPLVDLDPKLAVRPRLAESWEAVDPTTWRFKLRQGVKFSNGEDFNADAVKFTIDQHVNLDPPYFFKNLWAESWPPSVEVESASSVLIKTPKPQPGMTRLLTRIGMLPIGATKEAGYSDKPIATGPYKVVEWTKGQKLVLEANPGHWRGAPKIGQLVFQAIPDQAARVAALQAGEVDLIWDVPYDRVTELASAMTILEAPSLTIGLIAFNFRSPRSPIADVRVRRALIYAVDDRGIIEAIMSGKAIPSTGPSPALSVGAADASGYPTRDVAMAKKLLAEACHSGGLDLTFIFSPGQFAKDLEVVEAIVGQLGEAGVTVKLEELDAGQASQRRPTPSWDLTSNGTTGWTTEAQFFANQYKNTMGYSSATVDQLLEQANAAGDTPRRIELIQQTMKAMWDDVPYLWSFDRVFLFGMEKKLQGAEFIPVGWLLLHNAQLTG